MHRNDRAVERRAAAFRTGFDAPYFGKDEMMSTSTPAAQHAWPLLTAAADWLQERLDSAIRANPTLAGFAARLARETGTRLVDWVDHLALPDEVGLAEQLAGFGFQIATEEGHAVARHAEGIFPAIVLGSSVARVAIKAESAADFLFAQRLDDRVAIHGAPYAPLRMAQIAHHGGTEFCVVERHGYRGWQPIAISDDELRLVVHYQEAFRRRRRDYPSDLEGFQETRQLIRQAVRDLDVHRACELFFAAERAYWQSRNRAAETQKARQDALGLGWANHDHHTYRSSRWAFTHLIGCLEDLGFQLRERFYAGRDAGWGAQVLEQPVAGVVIFADVDLSADELAGDFAHDPLPPRDKLGTVGLWCKLHGEAFLQAGMHHLECQFDFQAAREQLDASGVKSMKPFTDFEYLKQCFTQGEIWPVDPQRIDAALDEGCITPDQAEQFRKNGAIGSHLEILQRDSGYKGFNQTGINEIIRDTDPRRA